MKFLRGCLCLAMLVLTAGAQPIAGKRHARLAIRNAMVVEGNGTPAAGPRDILIENNRILRVVASPSDPAKRLEAGAEIDAAGKYVLPGFVNLHGHSHDERGGKPLPVEYVFKLWLASGITTVRDLGSKPEGLKEWRAQSAEGKLAAPRLLRYAVFRDAHTPQKARERVREIRASGADGIKFFGVYREVMSAMLAEAKALGLRTAHHAEVFETNAWDDVENGTTSIEHWYGIPDAAILDRGQHFPPAYNYANETDRFRWAGRLWREADPKRLGELLDAMAKANVAWDPTLNIYEAARDLQRAQNQPQFRLYLHPVLAAFFEPNLNNHGSFFFGWSTADEVAWKENYRIWMAALRDFERRGGTIGAGEDAGYIYQMYGYGLVRELELHQEAGFDPLQVIRHATLNGAKVLGKENEIGRVREGWLADLLVVNGNPLENLKVLYPGGIEWTIRDGIPYHAPTLLQEVREMVERAR